MPSDATDGENNMPTNTACCKKCRDMDNDGGWYCLHPSCSCHALVSLPCRCGKDGAQCMIHNPPFPTNAERTGDKGLVMASGVVGKAPKLNESPSADQFSQSAKMVPPSTMMEVVLGRTEKPPSIIDEFDFKALGIEKETDIGYIKSFITRVYESGFKHGAKHEGSYEVAFKAGRAAMLEEVRKYYPCGGDGCRGCVSCDSRIHHSEGSDLMAAIKS